MHTEATQGPDTNTRDGGISDAHKTPAKAASAVELEALWSISFESDTGIGGNGIVVLEAERLFGGDSAMIYTGEYRIKENFVRVRTHVKRYSSPPGMVSVFGFNEFTLEVNGKYDENQMTLRGLVAEDPRRAITMKLVRRAEMRELRNS